MADISNANVAPNLDVDKLENENVTLVSILLDESGSMDQYQQVMKQSIDTFKKSIKNSKSADELLVSVTRFNGNITSGGFQLIDDVSTDYNPGGSTVLYDAIILGQKNLYDGNKTGYLEQLKANGIRVKAVLVIFSDGEDNGSRNVLRDAVDAIGKLKSQEILTAFVAFGGSAKGIAQQLGIADADVLETSATESELRKVFDILSKSAISSSQSAASSVSSGSFFV